MNTSDDLPPLFEHEFDIVSIEFMSAGASDASSHLSQSYLVTIRGAGPEKMIFDFSSQTGVAHHAEQSHRLEQGIWSPLSEYEPFLASLRMMGAAKKRFHLKLGRTPGVLAYSIRADIT